MNFWFHFRNLSQNPLTSYYGNPHHLVSLKVLDITGAKKSVYSDKLFRLPQLKEIEGLLSTNKCKGCTMTKLINDSVPETFRRKWIKKWLKNSCSYTETVADINIVKMAKLKFLYTRCKGNNSLSACLSSVSKTSPVKDACWEVTKNVLIIQYPIGITSIVLNLIVIVTVIAARLFKKSVLLLLTFNLAIGDFTMSLYSISATYLISVSSSIDYYQITCTKCTWIGLMWIFAQVTIVSSSVLLTLERYLATVFAVRVYMRLQWNTAFISIVVFCLLGIAVALLVAISGSLSCSYLCYIGNFYPESPSFTITAAISAPQIILYLVTLPMYIHIYVSAKNSGRQVGVRRESALARKIAILVLSNVFFFVLPLIVRGISIFFYKGRNKPFEGGITRDKIANFLWVICWNFSSCINPLLNAFRNSKFQKVLKNCWIFKQNRINPLPKLPSSLNRSRPTDNQFSTVLRNQTFDLLYKKK